MKKIIKLMIVVLFLSGCGYSLLPSMMVYGEKLCRNNDGVDYIFIDLSYMDVVCNNNARFENINKNVFFTKRLEAKKD